jgi:gas vesicle protein
MTKNGNRRGTGLFMAGAAIGAAVAVLTTPLSGRRLRRKVSHKIEDEADRLGQAARSMKDECDYLLARSQRMVRKLAR